jgi:Tol biopolymer transport system component
MAHEVARYLSIDEVESPTFTVDGDLVYLADTTGTQQVWRQDRAGAYPERLTPYRERVSFVEAAPTRMELAFGMDRGGNERDQLYRYDLTDGTIQQLTDEPAVKHAWGGWSPSGDRIAYTANREDRGAFDVYV